ncbi:MAG TPA: hypothetical protein VHP83_01585 [Aggregatilineaceae bacterium]|nr:hypothetical protein [Aggregatilineaceae bacterium]
MTRHPKLALGLIFALALLARFALIAMLYTPDLTRFQSGDWELYRIGGEYIRAEGDFSNSLFLLRPPLFPVLIALLDGDGQAVLYTNVIIGAAMAPLAVLFARQVKLSMGAALAVGVIVALDPANIAYSAWLGAEPLANTMFMIMLVALLHAVVYADGWRALAWAALAGVALSMSVWSRPAAYLIWTGLSVWLVLVYRRKWMVIAVYALVSVIGIGAWVVHNGRVFDNYTVSSVGAYSMLYYRAASVEHWGSGDDMDAVYLRLAARVEEKMGRDPSKVNDLTRHTHYAGSSELTDAMMETALETFKKYPAAYVFTIPIGLGRMYGFSSQIPNWMRPLEVLWNLVFVAGTAVGLGYAFRRRECLLLWITVLVCGYYTVGTLVAQTSGMDARMRTMLAPLMAAALVYGVIAFRTQRQGAV